MTTFWQAIIEMIFGESEERECDYRDEIDDDSPDQSDDSDSERIDIFA